MKRILNILLIAALLTGCCEDFWEKPPLIMELPPITEEGKDTFGCMIEDEVYVPQSRRMRFMPMYYIETTFPEYPNYRFGVTTYRFVGEKDIVQDAEVNFGNVIWDGRGNVILWDSIRTTGTYTLYGTVKYNGNYYQALSNTSSLMITKLDTINGIISGQFYFQAIMNNNSLPIDMIDPDSKIITISNGRFDFCKGYYD